MVATIWWHRTGSTLAQVMACCLTAPSHYLNECWFLISKAQWHSPWEVEAVNPWLEFEICLFKMPLLLLLLSPRGQWVKIWIRVDSPAYLIVELIFHWCAGQHNSVGFENNGKNQQYQLLYIAMTSHKWIPIQRASNEECVSMSWWHHDQEFDNTPLACIYFEEVCEGMSIIHVCHYDSLQFPDQFLAKGLEARWPFLCQFSLVSSGSSFFPPQSTRKRSWSMPSWRHFVIFPSFLTVILSFFRSPKEGS